MLHALSECVDVFCTERQITHELFIAFHALHLGVLNSIEDCTAEVNDKDFVVYEEIFRLLFLERIRNVHNYILLRFLALYSANLF